MVHGTHTHNVVLLNSEINEGNLYNVIHGGLWNVLLNKKISMLLGKGTPEGEPPTKETV